MESRIIIVGVTLALIVGAGAGYTFSPNISQNLELGEIQKNIRTLENDKLELQTVLASTDSENTELQEMLSNAKVLFKSIETELTGLESGFGPPDYDSGWNPIEAGEELTLPHGLDTTDNLFVYMIGRYFDGLTNQLYYGICYWGQFEVGCGWTIDDTNVHVHRGDMDVHWDEVRIYIWRIPQGPSGSSHKTDSNLTPDEKYVEIIITADEIFDYYDPQYINLEGYREVTITWLNPMDEGRIYFWWDIKKSDGTYKHVATAFVADWFGGHAFGYDDPRYDDLSELNQGSKTVKVGSKYLEISFLVTSFKDPEDELIIVLTARK